MAKFELDTTRGWWLLLRDILLFGLGAAVWWNELMIRTTEIREMAILAGGMAMALPFTLWQDKKGQ